MDLMTRLYERFAALGGCRPRHSPEDRQASFGGPASVIVVDTNVLSELMRPAPSPRVIAWMRVNAAQDVHASSITVAEIQAGVERLPEGRWRAELEAAAGEVFARLPGAVLPFDTSAANAYAKILTSRERAGAPINVLDAQIASICRVHGASLGTRNVRDFRDTGVTVVDPWTVLGPPRSSVGP